MRISAILLQSLFFVLFLETTIGQTLRFRRPSSRTPVIRRTQSNFQRTELLKIKKEIKAAIRKNPNLIPNFVQFGFHSCVGGCDGCINVHDADNRGIVRTYNQLKRLHKKHSSRVSLADYVVIASSAAVEEGMKSRGSFTIKIKIGRRTCSRPRNPNKNADLPEGNDPNAFTMLMKEFSMTRAESVTLLGAHSLGRARRRNSGFSGAWDFSENTLDNSYYLSMLTGNWSVAPIRGHPGKFQWSNAKTGLIMLPADMSMIKDIGRKGHPKCETIDACPNAPTRAQVLRYVRPASKANFLFERDFIKVWQKMVDHVTDRFSVLRNV